MESAELVVGAERAVVSVMVVDDQPSFRAVARRLIEATEGFTIVAEAVSGEMAVLQFDSTHPSFVLMDVHLPGISGIEATRRIVAASPSTAVVLTSTHDAPSMSDEAEECGAACYYRKEELNPGLLRDVWLRRLR